MLSKDELALSLEQLDKDGDAVVSKNELLSLEQLDKDGDGVVSKNELDEWNQGQQVFTCVCLCSRLWYSRVMVRIAIRDSEY